MHLPTSFRDRSFYANFYSRHPSEIEIIDLNPTSCTLRTLSESPTSITPLSDASSSVTSGFFSSSDCSSSESTGSYTRRRRTTAPTIQERLNTYESACHRPSLPLPSSILSKQKTQSSSALSPPSLVNQLIPRQISTEQITPLLLNTSTSIDNDPSKSAIMIQDDLSINDKSITLDSSKRYLSKSTSHLCDPSSTNHHKEGGGGEEEVVSLNSRNILDVIQEELSEIRRADHDLKSMFISIYSKIQNIQQIKSSTTTLHHQQQHHKGHRYHYHHTERPSRSIVHCCYSSNSDIRRMSCTHHHHHNRKYALHSVAALRNRMSKTLSTADNDSYVDTDSLSSSSDSGTCSSPVDNGPCIDD